MRKHYILLLCILPLHIWGESFQPSSASIKQLIYQVKHSSGDARREAMNQLKQKLRSANRKTREETMMALKKSMGSSSRTVYPTAHTTENRIHNTTIPHSSNSIPKTPSLPMHMNPGGHR